ncbi:MAG: G5 domain-containing protein [Fimbriimonadaceae bacterium]|nr:MAG: G5 domain-containing protein [Fimbriimonadaceae bacterium]
MRKLILTSLACATVIMIHPVLAFAQEQKENTVETQVKTEVIPYDVQYIFNRDITPGRVKKVTDGKDGLKTITITNTLEEGKVIDTKKEESVEPAIDAVFHMGKSGLQLTDRGSFTRAKVLTMESTAYLPSDGSGTGRTASGLQAKHGIVAVDPKVIKIGTLVYVEGYGLAVAADTGGAIKGNKIDVCIQSRSAAMQWGRRKVKVHIFTDRHTAGMAKRYR